MRRLALGQRRRLAVWQNDQLDPVVLLCQAHRLPLPEREFQFHPARKWRADYCWPAQHVILEVDGGIYSRHPSHTSIGGQLRDREKSNAAQVLGYRFFQVTPDQVRVGDYVLKLLRDVGIKAAKS